MQVMPAFTFLRLSGFPLMTTVVREPEILAVTSLPLRRKEMRRPPRLVLVTLPELLNIGTLTLDKADSMATTSGGLGFQVIRLRTVAETNSLTSTTPKMASNITDTSCQANRLMEA